MPTFNEVLYDYNPYFHACKFCIRHTGYIMKRGFGVVQKVRITSDIGADSILKPCSCGITLFYHSFFITRFLYLFLKVTAFFKVVGSNPGWGIFLFFLFFYHILHQKLC